MQPMYYIGLDVSQAQDQLLREGRLWPDSRRGIDFRHTPGTGPLDAIVAAAVGRGDGSDDVHGLDLRSSPAACRCSDGRAPLMLRAIAAAKKKNDRIDASKI